MPSTKLRRCKYDGCTYSHTKRIRIEAHVNSVHLHQKPFKCSHPGCGMSYSSKQDLQQHSKRHGPKTVICDQPRCDAAFYTRGELAAHKQRRHKKQQPCPIDTCEESFEQCAELIKHMQSEHIYEHENNVYVVPADFLAQIKTRFLFTEAMFEYDPTDTDDEAEPGGKEPLQCDLERGFSSELRAFITFRNKEFIDFHEKPWQGLRAIYKHPKPINRPCNGHKVGGCIYGVEMGFDTTAYQLVGSDRFGRDTTCLLCHKLERMEYRVTSDLMKDLRRDAQGTILCASTKSCMSPRSAGSRYCYAHNRISQWHWRRNDVHSLFERNLRKGPGSSIKNAADTKDYLDKHHLFLPAAIIQPSQAIFSAIQSNQRVFVLDTEFCRAIGMLQLCVKDLVTGLVIINTNVDWGVSINEHYRNVVNSHHFHTIMRVYGPPSNERALGKTPVEIATILRAAGLKNTSLLLEWSANRCDYRFLQDLLEKAGAIDTVPDIKNSHRVLLDWRLALPGFASWKLTIAFGFCFPSRSDLIDNAHFAEPDTEMLRLMTLLFLKHLFWNRPSFLSLIPDLSGDTPNDSLVSAALVTATEHPIESATEANVEMVRKNTVRNNVGDAFNALNSPPAPRQLLAPVQRLISHTPNGNNGDPARPARPQPTRQPLNEIDPNVKRVKTTPTTSVYLAPPASAPKPTKQLQLNTKRSKSTNITGVSLTSTPKTQLLIGSFFQASNSTALPEAHPQSAPPPAKKPKSNKKPVKPTNTKRARPTQSSTHDTHDIRSFF